MTNSISFQTVPRITNPVVYLDFADHSSGNALINASRKGCYP